MNMRIARSMLLIVVAVCGLAAAAGYTAAWWRDTVTSSGNVFASGTFDLKQRGFGGGSWTDAPLVAVWHASNMRPGQDLGSGEVEFKNCGSVHGSTFRIAVSNTSPELAKRIVLTSATYGDGVEHHLLVQSETPHIEDADDNGKITLAEFEASSLGGLPVPDTRGSFDMSLKFDEDAGNDVQSMCDTAILTFTLDQ